MAKREMPEFIECDVNTLNSEQIAAFVAYLRAKDQFRQTLQKLSTEHRILFTEKYGTADNPQQSKLKIAFVAKAKPKADKPKMSLAEFREAMLAGGRSI